MTRHEEQHRMAAESCPAGTLVLYRRGVYRSDWWPGEILGVAEFKPIPQAKKRKGLVSALCALEVLPAHSFKIMNFEGKHLTATKEYFYTMFENGFYEVPLGRIKPVMRRGSQHPSSQPPREPTFPAPTYGTFDGTPISHLLPYVLPIMKLIIKDLYMPIRENVDDWYQDPGSRALRGKQVRYGMFERRGETEVLVDEIARILLGVGKAREDLLCEDAGGSGSGDEDSSNDDKILGKQTGEEDKRQGEPAAPSSSLAAVWTQPSSESYDESHQSSRTCIDGLSTVSMEVDVGVNDDGMTPDSVVGTCPSLVPGERTTASSLPNTSRIIGSLRYEQLTDVARHQFVVDIVVKEVIIQLYLWRENIRTSLQTLNDDEENSLREQGTLLKHLWFPMETPDFCLVPAGLWPKGDRLGFYGKGIDSHFLLRHECYTQMLGVGLPYFFIFSCVFLLYQLGTCFDWTMSGRNPFLCNSICFCLAFWIPIVFLSPSLSQNRAFLRSIQMVSNA
ncbi:uncharacterized protein EI90DRAFT_3076608 [Cantharellus anzutake]|uniref:uncharacterized protein n=1 Tax=Cantharellus anzutake TaxID=1750568 RepID=UPI0019053D37|nr:uncharacterized protein EI90DRAFT_3076608 [Cantharellus anzutake]KAF8323626.1 hypothetical protein EI90DRAFT_3076608 [Cantharellus anzutake]